MLQSLGDPFAVSRIVSLKSTGLRSSGRRLVAGLVTAGVVLALAAAPAIAGSEAPQLAQAVDDSEINDPIEPVNRVIFDVNEAVYSVLLRPVATVYKKSLPERVREGIGNFLANLAAPITIANSLLQGDPDRAVRAVSRMVVNTIVGIGGINDAAADMGEARFTEDFGQTLAVWGVGEGFYLVLPILGPSNPRDAVGKYGVDPFLDPVNYGLANGDLETAEWSRTGLSGVHDFSNVMDELEQIKKTSVDYYATIRSMYRQKRISQISNGQAVDLPPIPNLEVNDLDLDLPSASAVTD